MVSMHPPPPPQTPGEVLSQEHANRDGVRKNGADTRSGGGTRSRSRSRNRSRNGNQTPGYHSSCVQSRIRTSRGRSGRRRSSKGPSSARCRSCSSSPLSHDQEQKGGEEKKHDNADVPRRRDSGTGGRRRRSSSRLSSTGRKGRRGYSHSRASRPGTRSNERFAPDSDRDYPGRGSGRRPRPGLRQGRWQGRQRRQDSSHSLSRGWRRRGEISPPFGRRRRRLAWAADNDSPRDSSGEEVGDSDTAEYARRRRRRRPVDNRGSDSSGGRNSSPSSPRSRSKSSLRRQGYYHRYGRSSTTRRHRRRCGRSHAWRTEARTRHDKSETSRSGSSFLSRFFASPSPSSSSSPARRSGRFRGSGDDLPRRRQSRRSRRGLPPGKRSSSAPRGRRRNRNRYLLCARSNARGRRGTGYRGRGGGGVGSSRGSSSSLSPSRNTGEGSSGCTSTSREGGDSSELDGVWRGFLAVSRRTPGGKFAPLEGKGVGDKNRQAVERARLQRERERQEKRRKVTRFLYDKKPHKSIFLPPNRWCIVTTRHRQYMPPLPQRHNPGLPPMGENGLNYTSSHFPSTRSTIPTTSPNTPTTTPRAFGLWRALITSGLSYFYTCTSFWALHLARFFLSAGMSGTTTFADR